MRADSLDAGSTEQVTRPQDGRPRRLVVTAGPDRGKALPLRPGRVVVGKSSTCDLVLTDPSVSSHHLEVETTADGVVVRDLDSTNGSWLAGARFRELDVTAGLAITLGRSELRLEVIDAATAMPASSRDRFGALLGRSEAMRRLFSLLERVAPTAATVLVEGETGTGKELVARALHDASPRAHRPFVVCDLSALSETLCDSELFGHVRGAFTGAERDRPGCFEEADGGTIFLDEIGELPAATQPRLLRALEAREVRRVGETAYRPVDVRVVAATNRDLAADVRAGTFRADLYHRLCIVGVRIPALRERPDDIPLLVETWAARAAEAAGRRPPAIPPDAMAALCAHDWPGNVRELRNVIERAVALGVDLGAAVPGGPAGDARAAAPLDLSVPFREAKTRLVDAWERDYVVALLAAADGNVSLAARRAGMDRAYLHRLLRKHGLGEP